ncbi:hypothetical protein WNY78_01960 [Psychroserpens sp. AS72]|uniref:hypothetical protein n=1 Tax=Psychroserpens sp. AS72 TaxID=3135775 RepID=UPI00318235BF
MKKSKFEINKEKLLGLFEELDESSIIVIKGHLLVEESLNNIIENFVHHSGIIQKARLSFSQKILIAKSMSLTEQNHSIWNVINKLNTLRNDFAHRLTSETRQHKIDDLIKLLKIEVESLDDEKLDLSDQNTALNYVISLCIGFLSSFEEEVDRFRSMINHLDKTMNK